VVVDVVVVVLGTVLEGTVVTGTEDVVDDGAPEAGTEVVAGIPGVVVDEVVVVEDAGAD